MEACFRFYELPWETSREEERRFWRIVKHVCIAFAVFSVILTVVPLPEVERDRADTVPPRFAKLILEKPRPRPPQPPRIEEPEPEPSKPSEPKVVEERQPLPEPKTVEPSRAIDKTEAARKKASVAGLLPFADELADLRDNEAVASVTRATGLTGAEGAAQRAERSMITSRAGASSGGINTAALSRDTGGRNLDAHAATAVTSTIAGLGKGPAVERPTASELPSRSREEIELVFDRNKGAIYSLYTRALRRDPTLQGKLVLRLTIEPSGVVSDCEIVSSEIEDEELQRKLVQRIKLFRFEARDVAPITTTKPIDFFPA
jgi:TonB family protein